MSCLPSYSALPTVSQEIINFVAYYLYWFLFFSKHHIHILWEVRSQRCKIFKNQPSPNPPYIMSSCSRSIPWNWCRIWKGRKTEIAFPCQPLCARQCELRFPQGLLSVLGRTWTYPGTPASAVSASPAASQCCEKYVYHHVSRTSDV